MGLISYAPELVLMLGAGLYTFAILIAGYIMGRFI